MVKRVTIGVALEACGFDFTSTTRGIARRFPPELDWGVPSSTILPFQVKKPFAGFGPIWKIPVNREIDYDLPPTMYTHEFHPTDDVRSNFDRAAQQLTAVLGEGQVGGASNAFERSWRIDLFTIRTIAWPRERNTTFWNVYEGHNPYLWISSTVYVQRDFPFIRATVDASEPIHRLMGPTVDYRIVCNSSVYARRNLVSGPSGTMVVGMTDDAFVVRAEDRSIRVPLGEIQHVVHTRMTPGRFAGSSSLALNTLFLGRHQDRVTFAQGEKTESLDSAAAKVGAALAVPVVVEQYSDDG